MTPVEVVLSVLGGGALFTFLGKVLELYLNRNKDKRTEWQHEIARLEGNIKELDAKVNHLQEEVETWKSRVDEWRDKYYALLQKSQLLEVAAAAKDNIIAALKAELARLRGEDPDKEEP